MKGTGTPAVKADETLLSILRVLHDHGGATVTEVADEVEISRSTAYKHLATLEEHDFVVNTEGYSLGFRFLELGGRIRDRNRVCQQARSVVDELSKRTDRLVMFVIQEGDFGFFVYSNNDKYGLVNAVPLGERYPLHQGAAGKAILAEHSDPEVQAIIDRRGLDVATDDTITDQQRLFKQLKEIRSSGYARSTQEHVKGFQSIAASVSTDDRSHIGAIAVVAPSNVPTGKFEDECATATVDAVNEVELQIRYM